LIVMRSHPYSRRQFLAGAAGALGMAALAGCSSTLQTAKAAKAVTASYRSRPDLKATLIRVTGPTGVPAAGYLFVTPSGPLIVDNVGEPIWINPVPHSSTNFRVQRYRGQPVLSWWQGEIASYGIGLDGEYVVVDSSYRQIMRVKARNGLPADLHEFLITGDDTAYFTAYETFTTDLRSVKGPKSGTALDATIQGLDLATGALVFDWHSRDHIPLTESYAAYDAASTAPFDPVHVNSIDTTADGKLLVSARNTWTVYKLDPVTGQIIWRLAGKKSDFTLDDGVRFAWQHDARVQPNDIITLFDDEGDPPEAKQSRGLVLNVDETAMTAQLVAQYYHPAKKLLAGSQGSLQVLPNSDVLVGWGAEPYYTEFRNDGTLVLDAEFAEGQSYRAFRFPWIGTPTEAPAVAVNRDGAKHLTVYASWNGSTETASWQVLAGGSRSELVSIVAAPRTGFETSIGVVTSASYVAARALDASGTMLATSPAVKV
jgi:Arylsulfotransferase (ASST)/TAT (twin-arginine translocation) pathway signal sequence